MKSNTGEATSLPGKSQIAAPATFFTISITNVATPDPTRTIVRANYQSPEVALSVLENACQRCARTSNPEMVTIAESVSLLESKENELDFAFWMGSVFVSGRVARVCAKLGATNMRFVKNSDALNPEAEPILSF